MKPTYSTGNAIVDEISEMNISGNVVPLAWFQTMVNENGKPMLLAIDILADIVYWYRPKEIRDEGTGALLGFKKRFKADYLQRSYRQIEDRFGVSKKQARNAIDYLCGIGVIRKHLRNENIGDGVVLHNSMYLELVPEKLKELTYPQGGGGVPPREPPCVFDETTVGSDEAEGTDTVGTTNTEITTKTTSRDYDNPIHVRSDVLDTMKAYERVIKKNIEYEYIIMDSHGRDKEQIDEIVSLMVETVSIERDDIMIGGLKFPYQAVKSQLLKLNSMHIRYVLECLQKNTTKVRNIRNYLLTTLYNAPNTIGSYYRAEVNHDLYGGENDGWI